jgi:hypothetical protein
VTSQFKSRTWVRSARNAFFALGIGAAATPASAQLFFSDLVISPEIGAGHISRVDPDGSNLGELVNSGVGTRGLALDLQAGKMYWADVNNLVIRRSNLDGSGVEDIITLSPIGEDFPFPSALAIHKPSGKLYWGDQTLGTMNRANLDGSNPEVLFSTPFHRGLAVDNLNGKLYWSTSISQFKGEVWKSNLDGSNAEVVLTSQDSEFKPAKMVLDVAGGKIYWTDYVVDIVRRANLDGAQIQTLYVPPFNRNPQGITLDLQNGIIYWGQDLEIEGTPGKIMAMNLDGSNAHDVVDGFGHVNEIVFAVPEPGTAIILAIGALGLSRLRRRT